MSSQVADFEFPRQDWAAWHGIDEGTTECPAELPQGEPVEKSVPTTLANTLEEVARLAVKTADAEAEV